MNQMFHDCIDKFTIVYLDGSKEEKSNLKNLEISLSRLRDIKLCVSPKKCLFMKEEISFLRKMAGKNGVRFYHSKAEVIRSW